MVLAQLDVFSLTNPDGRFMATGEQSNLRRVFHFLRACKTKEPHSGRQGTIHFWGLKSFRNLIVNPLAFI